MGDSTPPWMQSLVAGWPMIRANLPTFFVILVLIFGSIWALLDLRYGGVIASRDAVIANRDSEIALLKNQRDDYKDKLSGATPDQAKAKIDDLESRLAKIEPRLTKVEPTRLTPEQIAALAVALKPPSGVTYEIIIQQEMNTNSVPYVADLTKAFHDAGWATRPSLVMGMYRERPPSGLGLTVRDLRNPSPEAALIASAFRRLNIRFDTTQAASKDPDLVLFVSSAS